MEKTKITVQITAEQAGRLAAYSRKNRLEERATRAEFMSRGFSSREARIRIAQMRHEAWPSVESVVAAAVERRMSAADLAGPWEPLSAEEVVVASLSGRWPGLPSGRRLTERNYALPSDLVLRMRTASWRLSAEPLEELRSMASSDDPGRRAELTGRLYPPGRIVREALGEAGAIKPAP